MSLHEPKPPRRPRAPRPDPAPLTIGHIFGDAIHKARADQARRAELNAMGFKPLTGAP